MSDEAWFPHGDLPRNIAAFAAELRVLGFAVGPGETIDMLRALDAIELADRGAVEQGLLLVCCAGADEVEPFREAFERFFSPAPLGARQRLQPGEIGVLVREPASGPDQPTEARPDARDADPDEGAGGTASGERELVDDDAGAEPAAGISASRFSPLAGESAPPILDAGAVERLRPAAARLIARVCIGRSRRYRPVPRGPRFDFRRTLRASLQTGGEIAHPHWLGRPPRNPRFVVIVDGSRSMSVHAEPVLAFASALVKRTRRAEAFVFSTELCRVTDALRDGTVPPLAEAWGGGTRIGDSLATLLRAHGTRCLGTQTLVLIASDGLDVGDVPVLRDAMRELHRRSAGIVWLNPLLETPGYEPSAAGMRAALPYVSTFAWADDPAGFARLAETVTLR